MWHLIALIPAVFMTIVCGAYLLYAPETFGLPYHLSITLSLVAAFVFTVAFYLTMNKKQIEHT